MITKEQLESIGFKNDGETKSPSTGRLMRYRLYHDNGHVITGHDAINVIIDVDVDFVEIVIEHSSSWNSGKEQHFKGVVEDFEVFKQILESCCHWYSRSFKLKTIEL